ncbi:MAG TPA: fluoride efflux transporter CrcB [Acidimicrobiales bacterium]|nr:fluoride efflux transporter CrcB [Acidimicrobiales bacterium]
MTAAGVAGVVAAGAVGAPCRYLVDSWVTDRTAGSFPWGTLAVNLSGSVVLGFLTGLVLFHAFSDAPRLVVGTGFCGAYTTFSTFGFETVRLIEEGALLEAAENVVVSVIGGLAGAAAGLALAGLV